MHSSSFLPFDIFRDSTLTQIPCAITENNEVKILTTPYLKKYAQAEWNDLRKNVTRRK